MNINNLPTLKNRRGSIRASRELIENPSDWMPILYADFYPVIILDDFTFGKMDKQLSGYSTEFREVEEGEVTPIYEAIFTLSSDINREKTYTVEFKEITKT